MALHTTLLYLLPCLLLARGTATAAAATTPEEGTAPAPHLLNIYVPLSGIDSKILRSPVPRASVEAAMDTALLLPQGTARVTALVQLQLSSGPPDTTTTRRVTIVAFVVSHSSLNDALATAAAVPTAVYYASQHPPCPFEAALATAGHADLEAARVYESVGDGVRVATFLDGHPTATDTDEGSSGEPTDKPHNASATPTASTHSHNTTAHAAAGPGDRSPAGAAGTNGECEWEPCIITPLSLLAMTAATLGIIALAVLVRACKPQPQEQQQQHGPSSSSADLSAQVAMAAAV